MIDVRVTENEIAIKAPPSHVFALAANVAAWPAILPHYRYVRTLREPSATDHRGAVVLMAARRSGIPVRWIAEQDLVPSARRVGYRHVGGITRGMLVEWRIEAAGAGSRVTISHDLRGLRRWLRPAPTSWIVGRLFVMHIADRTLQGIKRQAERTVAREEV